MKSTWLDPVAAVVISVKLATWHKAKSYTRRTKSLSPIPDSLLSACRPRAVTAGPVVYFLLFLCPITTVIRIIWKWLARLFVRVHLEHRFACTKSYINKLLRSNIHAHICAYKNRQLKIKYTHLISDKHRHTDTEAQDHKTHSLTHTHACIHMHVRSHTYVHALT